MAQIMPAPVSPWSGLHSQFLASRDRADQVHIFDLSARAAQVLHRWAARYPLIRRVRVWPLALSVAAAAPFSSIEALVSTARVSLWVFTLDDLFDEERVPRNDLFRRATRYRAIAQGEPVTWDRDSLATGLREIRDDLARYPLFPQLGQEWADALCGTIDGMIQEYTWRQHYRTDASWSLPAYPEYLAAGRYSIGGPPHIWSAIITTNDHSASRCREHLHQMEQLASQCIRLANDLQSYTKELAEAKINALVILSRSWLNERLTAAAAFGRAEVRVRAEIAAGLEQLTRLQAAIHTETGWPEAAIADIARFVTDFYTNHDYHTFVVGRLGETERLG